MHDLRLVGVHDDGEHLVLADADGLRFRLDVDDALRAAVRRDRAHLGQLQIQSDGGLRPKDIQTKIRAGATAESIAAATGWPVDRIRRYEGPVLAERAHIAELAQSVRLRRRPAEQITLGTEVSERLSARGVDPALAEWDAWRADNGPWTLTLTFAAGGRDRQARWHFDVVARTVVCLDDEARWLTEQVPASADGPIGTPLAAGPPYPPGTVYDVDADGGVIATPGQPVPSQTMPSQPVPSQTMPNQPGLSQPGADGGPVDLMSAMRTRRADRMASSARSAPPPSADPTDIPGAPKAAPRKPSNKRPAAGALRPARTEPPAAHPRSTPAAATPPATPPPAAPTPAASAPPAVATSEPVPEGPTAKPRHRSAKSKRASVPSWDDIMFGAKRD